MKAIRPIFDNMDDLDALDCIDGIDMMVCLFSHVNESIASMEGIDEAQRQHLRCMTDLEIIGTKMTFFDMDIMDIDADMNDCRDEYPERMGTEFNELIVMFEIVRWLKECGYEWDAAVDAKYRHIAEVLGINSKDRDHLIDPCETGEYVLNTESRAFHELKLMLPLHWATILLDWYPISILGIDGEEAMVFGNLVIVCI